MRCRSDPINLISYSTQSPWLVCPTSTVLPIALPFVFAYVIGIPTLFAFLLWRNHKHHDAHVRYWLGFVYENFSGGKEYFEIIALVFRALLAASILLPAQLAGLFVMILLVAFICTLSVLQPYRSHLDSGLDMLACLILMITRSQIPVVSEQEIILAGNQTAPPFVKDAQVMQAALLGIISFLNLMFLLVISLVVLYAVWKIWRSAPNPLRLRGFAGDAGSAIDDGGLEDSE